ncbi:MAG TPA: hypothetical protein VG963_20005 [Polyangiaceae bacterium]|nr:hypothetical protein [Polyangiaceae bacterium]
MHVAASQRAVFSIWALAWALSGVASACSSDTRSPDVHHDEPDDDQDQSATTADDDPKVDAGRKPNGSVDAAISAPLDAMISHNDASVGQLTADGGHTAATPMDGGHIEAGPARDATVGSGTTPATYAQDGPYGPVKTLLNQGVGTITTGTSSLVPLGNDNDPSGFTLYYPEGGAPDERFPLLTWGDGTFTSPTFYEHLINHVVSYGFIVVGSNSADVGTGKEMLQAVEWALAQDQDANSPIHGKIDREQIGAFGHSQGGSGTVETGKDPRIRAIAPLSGVPLQNTEQEVSMVQCPTFYITTAGDIATPESVQAAYDATQTPAVFGVTNGGNHDEYADVEDDPGGLLSAFAGLTSNDGKRTRAAVAAWFDWQLKGRDELRALFVGDDCGFCGDSADWSMFQSKDF